MKKSVLLTLTPPKLTKQLREQAEKDIPVIDNAWGRRKEYKYNSYIKAKIEKGYLILSVFKTEFVRSGSKYPMYIVYFDRKKGEYLSLETETGKWRTAMLENLDAGLSCYNFKHYISEKDAEKIKKYLKIGEGDFYSICQYQSSLRTKRLDRQYKRKTDEWDQILKPVRSIPKDWNKWVLRRAISEHYIFYYYKRSNSTEGYCTCCGKKVAVEKPKYNGEGVCPNCGQAITYKSIGKFGRIWTKQETAYLIQRCHPGFIIREFSVCIAVGKDSYRNPVVLSSEENRYLYDKDFNETAFYFDDYKNRGARWIQGEANRGGYWYYYYRYISNCSGAVYPTTIPDLAKKELKMSGLPEILKQKSVFRPRDYFISLRRAPVLEQLVKANLYKLSQEVMNYSEKISCTQQHGALHTRLGISRNALKRLREQDGGLEYLVWLQEENTSAHYLDDDLIFWFMNNNIEPKDLKFIQPKMSFVQIRNYLIRQKGRRKDSISQVLITWRDYLSMAKRIKMDTDDEIVYRTSQLYQRHKEIIQYIEENRLSVTAGELADKYPNINEILSGLDKKYEYGNEIFTVLAPHCIEDILKEGQALHHCIDKKTEYLERINEQETYILFLRKTEQPDKPYYTLEVEPGGVIRQKRTEYDRQNKDIEEASEFLKEWQREIQKRITASDKKLADKSRQLRIESYAEMRKKKVKINGGLFQGKYLADVLEADLMEMPDTIEHAA